MHLTELIEKSSIVAVDIGKIVRHGKSKILYISAVKVCGWRACKDIKYDKLNNAGSFYRRISYRRIFCAGADSKKTRINVEHGECDLHTALLGFKNFLGDAILVGYDFKRFDSLLISSGKKYKIDFDNRRLDTLDIAKTMFKDKVKLYDLYFLHRMCSCKYIQPDNLCYPAIATAELLAGLAVRDEYVHDNY